MNIQKKNTARDNFRSRTCWSIHLLLLTFLFLTSVANAQNLDRSDALKILNKSGKLPSKTSVIGKGLEKNACNYVLEKMIQKTGAQDIQLNSEGRKYFKSLTPGFGFVEFTFLNPVKMEATSVTGITDAPPMLGGKAIEFTWRYVNFPEALFVCTEGTQGTGSAHFRQYDDGWRVEEIFGTKAQKSAADEQAARNIQETESNEAAQREQAAQQLRQQQEDMRRSMEIVLKEATTPTRMVRSFTNQSQKKDSGSIKTETHRIVITDVGVATFTDTSYEKTNRLYHAPKPRSSERGCLFSQIEKIDIRNDERNTKSVVMVPHAGGLTWDYYVLSRVTEQEASELAEVLQGAFQRWKETYTDVKSPTVGGGCQMSTDALTSIDTMRASQNSSNDESEVMASRVSSSISREDAIELPDSSRSESPVTSAGEQIFNVCKENGLFKLCELATLNIGSANVTLKTNTGNVVFSVPTL